MRALLAVMVAFSLTLWLGCKKEQTHILSEEDTIAILSDMLIVDELLVKYAGVEQEKYRDSLKMYILKKYDLTDSEFDNTMIDIQSDLKYYHGIQKETNKRLKELKKDQ